ncbi:HAD hydrolase-like protein [Nanohaloarchaea archaeon H01]|nr:HAD hydrolase-like protein [Nanohaloarchaea archaeon H01]
MKRKLYFNLDLTLTEMIESFDECFVEAMESLDVSEDDIDPELYSELFFDYFGDLKENPRKKALDKYCERKDLDIDSEEAVRRYCNKELNSVKPKENLTEVLEKLSKDFRLGIITAGTTRLQKDKLEKLEILEFIDEVLITYQEGKTKAEILKDVEDESDMTPIYFSNSELDIEKAEKAGIKTVYMEFANLGKDPSEKVMEVSR